MTTCNLFKSRFGFHPCDKEHYKKLRKCRYYLHITRQQDNRLRAWERKLPKNRLVWKKVDRGTWISTPWEKPECCDPKTLGMMMIDCSSSMPVTEENMVKPLRLGETELDNIITEMESWLVRIGKDKR